MLKIHSHPRESFTGGGRFENQQGFLLYAAAGTKEHAQGLPFWIRPMAHLASAAEKQGVVSCAH